MADESCYFCKGHPAHESQRNEIDRLKCEGQEARTELQRILNIASACQEEVAALKKALAAYEGHEGLICAFPDCGKGHSCADCEELQEALKQIRDGGEDV